MATEELKVWLFKFYHEVLKSTLDLDNRRYVEQLKQSVVLLKTLDESSRVDFGMESNQCAYLFEYGLIQYLAAASHFRELLEFNICNINEFISRGYLKICCLGGGPGMEAVAICKIIYDTLGDTMGCKPLDMYITIVDMDGSWRELETSTLNTLRESKELFNSNKMSFHLNFIKADLTKPFDPYVLKTIRKCQILTIVSRPAVKPLHSMETLSALLKESMKVMEYSTLISAIDYVGGVLCDVMENEISENPSYTTCLARLESTHIVNLNALNERLCLYNNLWGEIMGEKSTRFSSSAWIKHF